MKRLELEQSSHRDRISGFVVAVLIVLVFALSVGRIFAANRLVESSDKLRKMDARIAQLENQNQILAENVRRLKSTAVIEKKARESGFTVNQPFAFLTPVSQMAFGLTQ